MLLKQLELLVALNGAKTFSEAAPKLGRSQASISKAIQSLEHSLGVRIIEHGTDGISFTTKGKWILEKANAIHNDISNIKNIKYSFFHDIGGHFLMGCCSHTYNLLLVDMLVHLHKEYPNLHISLEDRSSDDIIGYVENRTYPLGLLQLNDVDDLYYQSEILRHSLRSIPNSEDLMDIVAGPNHPLANRGGVRLEELLSCSNLILRYPPSEYFELFLRQRGYRGHITVIYDIYTQRKVIENSTQHIAIIPQRGMISSSLDYHGNRVTIPIIDHQFKCRLYWVEHIQGYSKQEQEVVTLIKEWWQDTMSKEGCV